MRPVAALPRARADGGAALFVLLLGLALVITLPRLGALVLATVAPPGVRLAHGSVELVRVIDAGAADGMPAVPAGVARSGRFAVDADGTLYLWDVANGRVLVYGDASLDRAIALPGVPDAGLAVADGLLSLRPLAPPPELGRDERGYRYELRDVAGGLELGRIDARGRVTATTALDDAARAWDWYVGVDGAVYGASWEERGGIERLSVYAVLTALRD